MRTRSKFDETIPQRQEKNSKSLETTRLPNAIANTANPLEPAPRKIQTTPRLRKAAEVPPNLDLCKMWGEEVLQGRCEVVAPENYA
jgi:hypothetical protein